MPIYDGDKINSSGREINAFELLESFEIPYKYYINKRDKGYKPDQAFLLAQEYNQKRKNIVNLINEDNPLIIDGERYDTLYSFCVGNGLNYSIIYEYLLEGMDLYEAVKLSLDVKTNQVKYKWAGVSVKSICEKFHLCYATVIAPIRYKEGNVIYAIEKEILSQALKIKSIAFREYWRIYRETILLKMKDIHEFRLNSKILEGFSDAYYRTQIVLKELNYYTFLDRMRRKYDLDAMSVDERVQLMLNEDNNYSLHELYYIMDYENGLMEGYQQYTIKGENVWIYKGNVQILERLKK